MKRGKSLLKPLLDLSPILVHTFFCLYWVNHNQHIWIYYPLQTVSVLANLTLLFHILNSVLYVVDDYGVGLCGNDHPRVGLSYFKVADSS
jgi:hypothetical protein